MHLRRVLIFLTHQPIPIALNSDHWGSPLWIAGIILISSSSASEWKAQAKWQVDTPKSEIQIRTFRTISKKNKNNFSHTHVFNHSGKNFQAKKKEVFHHSGFYTMKLLNTRLVTGYTKPKSLFPKHICFFPHCKNIH